MRFSPGNGLEKCVSVTRSRVEQVRIADVRFLVGSLRKILRDLPLPSPFQLGGGRGIQRGERSLIGNETERSQIRSVGKGVGH